MIFDILFRTFGGRQHMGDMIANANIVEYLRKTQNIPGLKFHLTDDCLGENPFQKEFYQWLCVNTDYFSETPSGNELPWNNINIWDFRDISGDLVNIKNNHATQKKICICPLFDKAYNQFVNWPQAVYEQILNACDNDYPNHEKVICVGSNVELPVIPSSSKWTVCKGSLHDTLYHIQSSEVFFGGDTGTSHFASVINPGPELYYYTSSMLRLHVTPFYWIRNNKGTLKTYWLPFQGAFNLEKIALREGLHKGAMNVEGDKSVMIEGVQNFV